MGEVPQAVDGLGGVRWGQYHQRSHVTQAEEV